jgi:hypothetical protein
VRPRGVDEIAGGLADRLPIEAKNLPPEEKRKQSMQWLRERQSLLLEMAWHMLRPSVDRKENTHGLFSGSAHLSQESVELSDVGQLLPPATLDDIVPALSLA